MLDRLRRVTDLFVEGTELPLGQDEGGKPVLLWVNKLNSFQSAESHKDAIARRYVAIANLKNSGEYDGIQAELTMVDDERLAQDYVDLHVSEIYLDVMNDLDLDKEIREQREAIERLPELLDDGRTDEGAPERQVTEDFQVNWLARFNEAQEAKREQRVAEARAMSRKALEESFLEKWREMRTQAEFERELRATQIYYSLRRCEATGEPGAWDHTACDHSQRWLESRADVHDLPEALLARVQDTLDGVSVPLRAAGNSDAPSTSSGSSEPSSTPEAVSNPSSPGATPSAAPSI